VAGFCEHSNEPGVFTKAGNFLATSATGDFSKMILLHGLSFQLKISENKINVLRIKGKL
jgi:hypothetical protein